MGLFIMKPDFQNMSIKELRTYVLEHRGDDEAFYTLVDRRNAANPNRTLYNLPETPEEQEEMRRIIWQKLKESGELKEGRDYGDGFEVSG
jgi:hypothetical protein